MLGGGAARQREGRLDEARVLFERAIAVAPDDEAGWVALAGCLFVARRPDEALRVCDTALRRLGERPGLLCAKARVLHSLSKIEAAAALFQRALAMDPGAGEARYGLALIAAERGDWDEAAELTDALPPAWNEGPDLDWLRARIALGRGEFEAARVRAARLTERGDLPPDQFAEASLLLGEALDGLQRPDEAFAAFVRGKTALRGFYAERAAGRESEVGKQKRLAAWFRAADPAPWLTAPAVGASAVSVRGHAFLVGFPRSGTTLLEQALAGHPDLVALEEAPTLADAYAEFLSSDEGLARLANLSAAEAEVWRTRYWRTVAAHGVDPRGRVFLDKAPAGTISLPLIAKLFPDARVLFAVRDPRDVVLSCLRQSFQMNAMTYAFTDLAETAACYAGCMAMADAYRAVLPVALMEVRHEALVEDFESGLAEIAGFLGLAPTPGMADVAATARRRTVRTPSAGQVRAGVNRSGLGRWRAYGRELAPVMDVLAPWIERFGYGGAG